MLTESEIQQSWRKLFNRLGYGEKEFDRAEELLDQLRPESPLRLRLSNELDEMRRLCDVKAG